MHHINTSHPTAFSSTTIKPTVNSTASPTASLTANSIGRLTASSIANTTASPTARTSASNIESSSISARSQHASHTQEGNAQDGASVSANSILSARAQSVDSLHQAALSINTTANSTNADNTANSANTANPPANTSKISNTASNVSSANPTTHPAHNANTANTVHAHTAKAKPWVIVVNAPEDSRAHAALYELLRSTLHPVLKIIVMGAAAPVARGGHPVGAKYVALQQLLGCELLLCGLAAKNYGVVGDKVNPCFTLTGFMEILSLMHGTDKQDFQVINW